MTVTVDKLAQAIAKRLGHGPGEAFSLAHRVLNYFGFENVIIDNLIDQQDRKMFYALHDAGILRSSWETVLLLNGRNWRIFYWELNEGDLDRILGSDQVGPGEHLYESLPDEYWGRTASTS